MKIGRSKNKKAKENHSFLTFMVWFIILFVIGFLGHDYAAKITTEFLIKNSLGVRVSINSIDLNIFKNSLTIKRLIVYNPPGFSGTLAEIPFIYVCYDRDSIIQRKPYIKSMELSVYEISAIKNRNHEVNLNRFKTIIDEIRLKNIDNNRKIKVRKLVLSTDHLYFKDYTKDKPMEQRVKTVINREKFANLNNLDEIIQLVLNRVSNRYLR